MARSSAKKRAKGTEGCIFTESKDLTKDEFYQLITSLIRKEEANLKILKIIESREETEVENTEKEDEETEIEE